MKLLNWLRGSANPGARAFADARQTKAHPGSLVGPLVALHGFGDADWSALNYTHLAKNGYLRNPVVYRCVRMIAEAAASIPILGFEGKTEVDTHPWLDLLAEPNFFQSGGQLLDRIFSSLLIDGNAYLLLGVVDGVPKEIHGLNPEKVQPIAGEDGWPREYEYNVNGRTLRYPVDDENQPLLHLANYNPFSDFEGSSPLAAAHHALDVHNATNRWSKALLDNSARPSGALVYAAPDGTNLTPDQFDRLKSELENGYAGAVNAGRPLLLDGGLDWKPMAFSPKDMDFIQSRNSAARDIALAFGVPPMLLGIPGDNTYSNYQEANRVFWRQTVLPLAGRFAKAFERWMKKVWPEAQTDLRLDLDLDAIEALAADRRELWKQVSDAPFLTINEKRMAIGYGEVDITDFKIDQSMQAELNGDKYDQN